MHQSKEGVREKYPELSIPSWQLPSGASLWRFGEEVKASAILGTEQEREEKKYEGKIENKQSKDQHNSFSKVCL